MVVAMIAVIAISIAKTIVIMVIIMGVPVAQWPTMIVVVVARIAVGTQVGIRFVDHVSQQIS